MKKPRLIICIMLSALCMAIWSCKGHDDDDDNPINPFNPVSLVGTTWRYDSQKTTALINFSTQRFIVSATEFNHDSYETAGTYSYDGENLEFTYNGTTYKVWCSVKGEAKSLVGTKWVSETTYSNGRIYTGSAEFYSNGHFRSDNFLNLGYYDSNGLYSYNGQSITLSYPDKGSVSLECGNILYEMAQNDYNIW